MFYSKVRKPFIISVLSLAVLLPLLPAVGQAEVCFEEGFEDGNFSSRGWYDKTSHIKLLNSGVYQGKAAAEFIYKKDDQCPYKDDQNNDCKVSMRKEFNETRGVYISYRVKYSSEWANNGQIDQHEIYVLTGQNNKFGSLPEATLAICSKYSPNAPGVTIRIATIGKGKDDDKTYWEGSNPSTLTVDEWHHIELFAKLNSGEGNQNGEIRLYVDREEQLKSTNVVFRIRRGDNYTQISSTTNFNQFAISPYIFPKAPESLKFWIDDLKVCDWDPLSPPQHLRPIIN